MRNAILLLSGALLLGLAPPANGQVRVGAYGGITNSGLTGGCAGQHRVPEEDRSGDRGPVRDSRGQQRADQRPARLGAKGYEDRGRRGRPG